MTTNIVAMATVAELVRGLLNLLLQSSGQMFDRREATTVGNGQEIKFCAIDKLYGLSESVKKVMIDIYTKQKNED